MGYRPSTCMSTSTTSKITYKGNFIVFLGFRFSFAEDMFIFKENPVRNNPVRSLDTHIHGLGDFPHFQDYAETLSCHDQP
jgi:hypothetical protein